MKTKTGILSLVALAFPLAAFAGENIEPIHDGKRLSEWFAEFLQTPAYVTPATRAIEALGSDAVPYLVQFLSPHETNSWTKRAAMSALDSLNDKAQAATPELVLCLKDGDAKVAADAAYSLPRIGAGAKSAISELKEFLQKHRGDGYSGLAAVTALWAIDRRQTPLVVEALGEMLVEDGRWQFDTHVLDMLREIGPPARSSLTVLQRGLREEENVGYREIIAATMAAVDGPPASQKDGSGNDQGFQPGEYRCERLLPGSTLILQLSSDGKYPTQRTNRVVFALGM